MHTSASSALVCGHARRAHASRDAARAPTTADDARTISPPYHISNTPLGPARARRRDEPTPHARSLADCLEPYLFRAYPTMRSDYAHQSRITRARAKHDDDENDDDDAITHVPTQTGTPSSASKNTATCTRDRRTTRIDRG